MELSVTLLLLLMLVVAFAAARNAAQVRRRKALQERERQRRKKAKPVRRMSNRAEMRAYDDPSTFANDVTTTHGSVPMTDQSSGTMSAPPLVADRKATQGVPGDINGPPAGTTGTQSREPGKPRA